LPGQVWVVCANNDIIAGLNKTNAYITKSYSKKATVQKIFWVASIFEWKINGMEETKMIASMPSRETLLSRLVGSLQAPIAWLTRFLDALAKELEAQWVNKVSEMKKKAE
jgi:ribosomal protein L10